MNVFVHIRRYVGGRSSKQIAGGKRGWQLFWLTGHVTSLGKFKSGGGGAFPFAI